MDDGAQIVKVEEYEPEKFIALTWWTNKIYLFERRPNFLINDGSVCKEATRIVEPSFGISFQCVGLYKLPRTKSILILKLKEGLIMFDAESEEMFKLNSAKSNSSQCGNLIRVEAAPNSIMPYNTPLYNGATPLAGR